jgi:hypothetical protein
MKSNYPRIGAAMGAVFVLALIAGGTMETSGGWGASDGPGILADLQRDPTIVNKVGFAIAIGAFIAFLAFLGYVYRVLRQAEGPDGWLGTVALGGGLLYLAIKVGSAAPIMAGFHRKNELTPDLARTLVDLNDAAFVVSGLMFGVFTAAAAATCLAHRVLPRSLGWLGLIAGLLTIPAATVGMLDMASYNPMPFLAGTLWTLIVSIVLTARPRPAPAHRGSVASTVGAETVGRA